MIWVERIFSRAFDTVEDANMAQTAVAGGVGLVAAAALLKSEGPYLKWGGAIALAGAAGLMLDRIFSPQPIFYSEKATKLFNKKLQRREEEQLREATRQLTFLEEEKGGSTPGFRSEVRNSEEAMSLAAATSKITFSEEKTSEEMRQITQVVLKNYLAVLKLTPASERGENKRGLRMREALELAQDELYSQGVVVSVDLLRTVSPLKSIDSSDERKVIDKLQRALLKSVNESETTLRRRKEFVLEEVLTDVQWEFETEGVAISVEALRDILVRDQKIVCVDRRLQSLLPINFSSLQPQKQGSELQKFEWTDENLERVANMIEDAYGVVQKRKSKGSDVAPIQNFLDAEDAKDIVMDELKREGFEISRADFRRRVLIFSNDAERLEGVRQRYNQIYLPLLNSEQSVEQLRITSEQSTQQITAAEIALRVQAVTARVKESTLKILQLKLHAEGTFVSLATLRKICG